MPAARPLVLLLLVLSVASAPAAAEGEVSARYTGGGARVDGILLEADLAAQYGPVRGVRLGGAAFRGGEPTSVEVRDDAGLPVGVLVCQDRNGDLRCGANEPYLAGCGPVLALSGFRADVSVLVFPLTSARCGGAATSGTVTLRMR